MSERRAVVLLYGVALASGAVGFVSLRYGLSRAVSLVGVLAIGVALLGVYLGRLKVYAEGDVPPPESRIVTLFSDFAYKRQVAAVAIDLVLVVLAYYTSYMLRFEDRFDAELPVFVQSLPVVIICQMAAFAVFGVYQSMWRYTGMREVLRLAQAVTVGTTAAVLVLLFLHRFFGYSRAVFVIDWIVLVGAATMARLSFRALQEVLGADTSGADPVIVYGAGNGGAMVLREIRGNQALGLRVAAFLDDDRSKSRTSIGGVPVAGGIESLKDAITKYQPTQLIFSTDKVSPDRLARVTALCEEHGIIVRRARIRFE